MSGKYQLKISHLEIDFCNVKPLIGVDAKRLRVGDFRVIFTETTDTITILDTGPRDGIHE